MNQKSQLVAQFQTMSLHDKFDKILVYVDGLRQADENYVGLYTLLLENKTTLTDAECTDVYNAILDIVYHNSTNDQLTELVKQISQKK